MTTILDQVKYKEQVVGHIRRVFPNTEWFSNEEEGYVRVESREGKYYGARFHNVLSCIELGLDEKDMAVTMVNAITSKIIREDQT